jgi:hemolysin activation/secretion protein
VPETARLSGAARLWVSAVSSGDAPFYQQSWLGGASLLRGFADGRFVARHAWTLDLEQRIRLLRTDVFGVITDWRIDPFVGVGQVFDRLSEVASRPRPTVGLGLRAFAHPNVVGRVDLAFAGEGLKIYVDVGYPY